MPDGFVAITKKTPKAKSTPVATGDLGAGELLREAAQLVEGNRNQTHGSKERSFEMIARDWSLHILDRFGVSVELTPEDVCWMMVQLKRCRRCAGEPIKDHALDAAGYAAISWELAVPKKP